MSFGWSSPFGSFGSFGGAGGGLLSPADQAFLVQWLYSNNGSNVLDRLVVATEPDIVDGNAKQFTGAEYFDLEKSGSISTGDFRISFRVKSTSSAAIEYILSDYQYDDSERSMRALIGATDKLDITLSSDGTATQGIISVASIADGTWKYIQVMRIGTGVWIYIDGLLDNYLNTLPSTIFESGNPIRTGALYTGLSTLGKLNAELSNVEIERTPQVLDVYAYVGQSNAEGVPLTYGSLPTKLQSDNIHFYEYSIVGGISTAQNLNLKAKGSTQWGAELTFGQELYTRTGRRHAILKVTKGGSSMHTDWRPGGEQYEQFKTAWPIFAADIVAAGYTVGNIRGIISQGENDRTTVEMGEEWEAGFDAMTSGWEAELGIDFKSWVVCRTQSNVGAGSSALRISQENVGTRSGNGFVDTDGYPLNPDLLHYTEVALQTMGVEIADVSQYTERASDFYIECGMQDGTKFASSRTGNHGGTIAGALINTTQDNYCGNHLLGFDTVSRWDTTKGSNFDTAYTPSLSDWNHEIVICPFSFVFFQEVISSLVDNTGIFLRFNNATGQLACRVNNVSYQTTGAVPLYKWSRCVTKRVSGVITLEAYDMNGNLRFSEVVGTNATAMPNVTSTLFASPTAGRNFDGLCSYASFDSGAKVFQFNRNSSSIDGGTVNLGTATLDEIFDSTVIAKSVGASQVGRSKLSNLPAITHNGSECGIIQTDAQLLDNLFYSADGITFDRKYIADYLAAKQWEFNNLFQWIQSGGVCQVKEVATYIQAYSPVLKSYNQGLKWAQKYTSSCGGGVIPFEYSLDFSKPDNSFYLI